MCLMPEKKQLNPQIESFLMCELVRKILGVLKFSLFSWQTSWEQVTLKICEDFILRYFILKQEFLEFIPT